ncbi:hypothetical protein AAD001_14150 [Colwelliaceae bacterium 6471]
MKYVIVFLLVCQSFIASASETLSKKSVQAFFEASEQISQLKDEYPGLLNNIEELGKLDAQNLLDQIENSPAYPEIKAILAKANVEDLNELMAISQRIMGSVFSAHMQQNPMMAEQLKAMNAAQLEHIAKMKSKGLPESVVAEMEAQLAQTKVYNERMNEAVKSASTADIQFVKDNLDWVMSLMQEVEQ